MFEELKAQIALQNVQKIKRRQRQLQSLSDCDDKDLREDSYSQEEEFTQRLEMFKLLMDNDEGSHRKKISQAQLQSVKMAKLLKEKQLLQQKIKIDQEHVDREMNYLNQKYQRQIETLKIEIQNYQYQLKKAAKEEGIILSLKKDNRNLLELYSQTSETLEKINTQNASLNKEISRLKTIIQQKQDNQTYLQKQQYQQTENQKTLKLQIETLFRQKALDTERKKQLEATTQRLRAEIDQVTRELDHFKMRASYQKQQLIDKNKTEMSKLQQQNIELKRRNQKLEQSFIEHLTQTSLNLQNNLRHIPDKSGKNTTLYLQETPIKSRSKERESRSPEEQDPEKSECPAKHCPTNHQLSRLKLKLKQANNKIVQLLQQKCSAFRQR